MQRDNKEKSTMIVINQTARREKARSNMGLMKQDLKSNYDLFNRPSGKDATLMQLFKKKEQLRILLITAILNCSIYKY